MNEQGRIVVGVDGSPTSRAALAWAAGQARLTDASVEAVMAWQYPISFARAAYAPVGPPMDTDYAADAEQALGAVINETLGESGPIKVSAVVRQGNPAQVLLAAATGADLLVLGSRGHGGFAEALLGSVSQHCVHHATCPVVVVRGSQGLRARA